MIRVFLSTIALSLSSKAQQQDETGGRRQDAEGSKAVLLNQLLSKKDHFQNLHAAVEKAQFTFCLFYN